MYKCKDCGAIFEEPYSKEDYEYADVGIGKIIVADLSYDDCPHCHGSYEKAYECSECGEYFLMEEMAGDICKNCLNDKASIENLINFGEENKEELKINGFLLNCFSLKEIENILKTELLLNEKREQRIKDFTNEYGEEFSKFLRRENGNN